MNDSPRRGTQLVRDSRWCRVHRLYPVENRCTRYEGGSGRGRGEEKETKGGTALNNVPLAVLFAFYEAQFRLAWK
jgi:hypothetical protein